MYVSCCVVFPVTVVDYVCFMLCCIYNDSSGLYMYVSCYIVFTMAVVDYTFMFHAVLYLQ